MTTMDAKAAADLIRPEFLRDPVVVDPADVHQHRFLEEVCRHLGVVPDAITAGRVSDLLAKHHVDRHLPQEYPKMLTRKHPRTGAVVAVEDDARQPVIFNDADEEEAWMHDHPGWDDENAEHQHSHFADSHASAREGSVVQSDEPQEVRVVGDHRDERNIDRQFDDRRRPANAADTDPTHDEHRDPQPDAILGDGRKPQPLPPATEVSGERDVLRTADLYVEPVDESRTDEPEFVAQEDDPARNSKGA